MNPKLIVIVFNLIQRNRKLQEYLKGALVELGQVESLLKILLEGLNIEALKSEQQQRTLPLEM